MSILARPRTHAEIIPIEGKTYHFEAPELHDPVKYKFTERQLAELNHHVLMKFWKWCFIFLLAGILSGAAGMGCYNYRKVYDSGYVHATRDFKKQVSDLVERYHNTLLP